MCWVVPPVTGLIEPAIAPEFVVDGIGAVEVHNGNLRIYLFSNQMPLELGPGLAPQKVIACKIVGPVTNIPAAIGQLASCLVQKAEPWRPRVVS